MNFIKFNIYSVPKFHLRRLECYENRRKIACLSKVFNKFSTSAHSIRYAQPTPSTHPHLLKNGEVLPGIKATSFQYRRERLVEMIRKTNSVSSHIVIIPSASIRYMSENIPYAFRQNSDFLYLSGFKEANSVVVITSTKPDEFQTFLFVTEPSAHSVRWEGEKMTLENLRDFLLISETFYLEKLENFLQNFAKSNKNFLLWYDYLRVPLQTIHDTVSNFMSSYSGMFRVESPRSILHNLRLIKSPEEIQLMHKACVIAAESMKETISFSYAGIPESHLQAKMDYECRMRGAQNLAFPPVVGGGDRANTIHYIDNNHLVCDKEMVLMDAGCEYHGYASDMARTWPVNGKFTEPQLELYNAVLTVQKNLVELCKTKLSLDNLFEVMCMSLGVELQKLGIIAKTASDQQIKDCAFELCPHHVSHYLGMDVHDTETISRANLLRSGMVVTIEPGVYIASNNTKCPEKYRGLCIRIEDDILITDEGIEILTEDCPKESHQIEQLLAKKS